MWFALRVLIVIVLAWHSEVSASVGRPPSIKHCTRKRGVIDCRNMGFQNVPYDVFSVPGVRMYVYHNFIVTLGTLLLTVPK